VIDVLVLFFVCKKKTPFGFFNFFFFFFFFFFFCSPVSFFFSFSFFILYQAATHAFVHSENRCIDYLLIPPGGGDSDGGGRPTLTRLTVPGAIEGVPGPICAFPGDPDAATPLLAALVADIDGCLVLGTFRVGTPSVVAKAMASSSSSANGDGNGSGGSGGGGPSSSGTFALSSPGPGAGLGSDGAAPGAAASVIQSGGVMRLEQGPFRIANIPATGHVMCAAWGESLTDTVRGAGHPPAPAFVSQASPDTFRGLVVADAHGCAAFRWDAGEVGRCMHPLPNVRPVGIAHLGGGTFLITTIDQGILVAKVEPDGRISCTIPSLVVAEDTDASA
jgi:hypothetical protein